jgi:hypothetical protein
MKRSRNASPGPSKRPRAGIAESAGQEADLSSTLVPARPPIPVAGLAVRSARAGQDLRLLEDGDVWTHVDNRVRRELFGWTWEDRLGATGELLRTPVAFSGYTVVVGNIKIPEHMDEVDAKKRLFWSLSVHGRIVSNKSRRC